MGSQFSKFSILIPKTSISKHASTPRETQNGRSFLGIVDCPTKPPQNSEFSKIIGNIRQQGRLNETVFESRVWQTETSFKIDGKKLVSKILHDSFCSSNWIIAVSIALHCGRSTGLMRHTTFGQQCHRVAFIRLISINKIDYSRHIHDERYGRQRRRGCRSRRGQRGRRHRTEIIKIIIAYGIMNRYCGRGAFRTGNYRKILYFALMQNGSDKKVNKGDSNAMVS